MHRASTEPNYVGGLIALPQADIPDRDSTGQEPAGAHRQQRWTPQNFRNQVQYVLLQGSADQEQRPGSVRNSPAFSDTTLVGGDYLDVPTHDYEEVDLGNYVEYFDGYYGPEPRSLSPTPSTKASFGPEVHSVPDSDLSPGGLYVDDPFTNISYLGSEGKLQEDLPQEPRNFKPIILGWRFLSALFFTLAVLVALAELGIQLLPNESGIATPSHANTTEIRVRSVIHDRSSYLALFERQNDTAALDGNSASSTVTSVSMPTPIDTTSASTSILAVTTPSSSSSRSTSLVSTSLVRDSTTSASTDTTIPTPTVTVPSLPVTPTSTTPEASAPPPPPPPGSTPTPTSVSESLSASTSSSSEALPPPPPPPPPPSASMTSTTQTLPAPPSSTTTSSPVEVPPPASTSETPPLPSTTSQGKPPPVSTSSSPITSPTSSTTLPSPSTSSSTSSIASPPSSNTPPSSSSSPFDPSTATSSTTPQGPPWVPTWSSDTFTSSATSLTVSVTQVESSTGSYTSYSSSQPSSTDTTLTDSTLTSPMALPSTSVSHISTSGTLTTSTTLAYSSSTLLSTESASSSSTITNESTSRQQSTSAQSTVSSIADPTSASYSSSYLESHTSDALPPSSSTQVSAAYTTEQSVSYNITTTTAHTSPTPFTTITDISHSPITTTVINSVSQSDGSYSNTTMVSVIHMFEELDIAEHVVTHKDSRGKPTWTETVLAQPSYGMVTLTDADGKSKTTPQVVLFYPSKTALTNYQGLATRTLDYYVTQVANVLSDKNGNPTATEISTVSETVSLSTVFDGKGVAIKTKTDLVPMSLTTTIVVSPTPKAPPSSTSSKDLHIVPISDGKYFLGLMLPTFIAILVSIPIRIIDRNAKLYQPFHDLATPRGVQARDSLCVQTADIWSFRARIRSLLNGQVLLTLTGLLLLGSVILIPLSSEAVRIILTGPNCAASKLETLTCKMALGVHTVPAQIAVALLIFMTALAGAIALVLRNWRTGLDWNPWSLVRMAQLGANNEIRNLLLRRLREKNGRITNKAVNKALAGIPFVLDFWKDNEELKYSILIPNEAYSKKDAKSVTFKKGKAQRLRKHGDALPFFILTWTGKLLFLALLCTVQVGLLTYNIAGEGIDYSEFMLGRWRAVRFIFTLAGVLISLMWGSLFYAVSFLSPHKLLRRIRLYNGEAAHMTPPTNPFSGLRSSLSPGRRDLYLGLVSATAILSEVLPLLLSVALDKCTESFWANTVCLWMAVSVLSIMIFMVAGSFFVTWPHMPIDPSTIAGGMYYCLRDLVSMSPSSGLLLGRASPNLV